MPVVVYWAVVWRHKPLRLKIVRRTGDKLAGALLCVDIRKGATGYVRVGSQYLPEQTIVQVAIEYQPGIAFGVDDLGQQVGARRNIDGPLEVLAGAPAIRLMQK